MHFALGIGCGGLSKINLEMLHCSNCRSYWSDLVLLGYGIPKSDHEH